MYGVAFFKDYLEDYLYFSKALTCFRHLYCSVNCKFFTITFKSIFIIKKVHYIGPPKDKIGLLLRNLSNPIFVACYQIFSEYMS